MQLFLAVGSLNSNTVDSPSLSDVGVLLAGEDDIKADAAGSVNGEGLDCAGIKPAGERRRLTVLPTCSANRRASSGLQE